MQEGPNRFIHRKLMFYLPTTLLIVAPKYKNACIITFSTRKEGPTLHSYIIILCASVRRIHFKNNGRNYGGVE